MANKTIGTDASVEIYRGEEPADIVASTALQLGLPAEQQEIILTHLCANVPCRKKRMKSTTMYVMGLGKVEIDQAADPVEKVQAFMDQCKGMQR